MRKLFSILAIAVLTVFAFSSCKQEPITPDVVLKGISVAPATHSLKVGETVTLTATYDPQDATVKPEIVWSSSKPEVATVSDNGVVTAVAAGTADITATADKFTAKCVITVTADGEGPEYTWDYTAGAAYNDAGNLWKAVDAAHTFAWYYNPNWAGEKEAPAVSFKESTYEVTIPDDTSGDWQAQVWILPETDLVLDNTKTYTFSCKVGATAETPIYFKLYQKGVDGAWSFETSNTSRLRVGPDAVLEIKGEDFLPITTPQSLLIDFGGAAAGTTIYIKDITLVVSGEAPAATISVNGVGLVADASGLMNGKVTFTKDAEVTISGIDNIEDAWNRDFFEKDGNSFKFIRESGEYDVTYSPVCNYLWVYKADAVGPDCLWLFGHGYLQAPKWNAAYAEGGWGYPTLDITWLGYAVPIAENKYQCSVYLADATEHTWGAFEFEVLSNFATWNKDYGFGGVTITGDNAGMKLSNAADGKPGLAADEGFVGGYFKLVFDVATGEINVTRLSGSAPAAWDYTPSAAYLAESNLWKPIFDNNYDYVYGQITGYQVVDITACPSVVKKESTYEWTFEGATEGEWGCCNFLAPLADHPVALKAGTKYNLKVTIGSTAAIQKFIFSLHTYKADADNREGDWLTDMWGEVPANTPTTFTQEFTPSTDLANIAWTIIPQFGTPAGMKLYIKDLIVEEVKDNNVVPEFFAGTYKVTSLKVLGGVGSQAFVEVKDKSWMWNSSVNKEYDNLLVLSSTDNTVDFQAGADGAYWDYILIAEKNKLGTGDMDLSHNFGQLPHTAVPCNINTSNGLVTINNTITVQGLTEGTYPWSMDWASAAGTLEVPANSIAFVFNCKVKPDSEYTWDAAWAYSDFERFGLRPFYYAMIFTKQE